MSTTTSAVRSASSSNATGARFGSSAASSRQLIARGTGSCVGADGCGRAGVAPAARLGLDLAALDDHLPADHRRLGHAVEAPAVVDAPVAHGPAVVVVVDERLLLGIDDDVVRVR